MRTVNTHASMTNAVRIPEKRPACGIVSDLTTVGLEGTHEDQQNVEGVVPSIK